MFDERKTTAAASYLLSVAGGTMPYLRLMKLLYLSDRESWREFGRPISGDKYVAMGRGPVLSRTLDLIHESSQDEANGPWNRAIKPAGRYNVRLEGNPDFGPLSEAEIEILQKAHDLHVQVDVWKLCEITHLLPEWSDPGESCLPIRQADILRALGKSDEEIEEAFQEAHESDYFDRILGAPA